MNSSDKLPTRNQNLIRASLAGITSILALAGAVAWEHRQTDDRVISVGNVTCRGENLTQLEPNTTIDQVVNNLKPIVGFSEVSLTENQARDFKTIVIKSIVDDNSEQDLYERPTVGGPSVLAVKYTVVANLPSTCQAYNFYF